MIVTRIVSSKNLHAKKRDALAHIAKLLGEIRAEVWRRYGSVAGADRTYFDVRDEWMRSGRKFSVPARLWKETLHDVLSDIAASRAAAKEKIHRAIFARTENEDERKRLFMLLKYDKWMFDPYLRRMMRKYFKHGQTEVNTHIKLDSGCYDWFSHGGHGWIAVQSLERGKRISIPLTSNQPISGTIRLIVKEKEVEIHHTIEVVEENSCGDKTIGVDKGYTEVFVDSDGQKHGDGLGKILSAKTESNETKYQHRNRLKAIAEKSDPAKRERMLKNNLGREKLDAQKKIHLKKVQTIVYSAAHSVVDKAKVIAAEDLTSPIKESKTKRTKGKKEKRLLSGWVKGIIAEALKNVSQRRGSTLHLVNCAYSSQVHSACGCLGTRDGDVLHCDVCGVDAPSDAEAAREVLARLNGHEIGRWTPYKKVRTILQERTERHRLRLSNQDSSCTGIKAACAATVSTESELPISSMGNCG